jgi:hypothetical protein
MLSMHASHIKLSKPAVPQYMVALGGESNTVAGTSW